MIYFTSDTHFFHANVIKYCNRPFDNVFEMNAKLTSNWNEIVRPTDFVYHIGDTLMGQRAQWGDTIKNLNGYKILIKGNHDRSASAMLGHGFQEVMNEHTIEDPKWGKIYMRHIPREDFRVTGAAYHICGHVHDDWARHGNIINAGVDVRNYRPVTLDELMATIEDGPNSPTWGERKAHRPMTNADSM